MIGSLVTISLLLTNSTLVDPPVDIYSHKEGNGGGGIQALEYIESIKKIEDAHKSLERYRESFCIVAHQGFEYLNALSERGQIDVDAKDLEAGQAALQEICKPESPYFSLDSNIQDAQGRTLIAKNFPSEDPEVSGRIVLNPKAWVYDSTQSEYSQKYLQLVVATHEPLCLTNPEIEQDDSYPISSQILRHIPEINAYEHDKGAAIAPDYGQKLYDLLNNLDYDVISKKTLDHKNYFSEIAESVSDLYFTGDDLAIRLQIDFAKRSYYKIAEGGTIERPISWIFIPSCQSVDARYKIQGYRVKNLPLESLSLMLELNLDYYFKKGSITNPQFIIFQNVFSYFKGSSQFISYESIVVSDTFMANAKEIYCWEPWIEDE